jgi:hypothetical protein
VMETIDQPPAVRLGGHRCDEVDIRENKTWPGELPQPATNRESFGDHGCSPSATSCWVHDIERRGSQGCQRAIVHFLNVIISALGWDYRRDAGVRTRAGAGPASFQAAGCRLLQVGSLPAKSLSTAPSGARGHPAQAEVWKHLGGGNRRTRQRGCRGESPGRARIVQKSDAHIIRCWDAPYGCAPMG